MFELKNFRLRRLSDHLEPTSSLCTLICMNLMEKAEQWDRLDVGCSPTNKQLQKLHQLLIDNGKKEIADELKIAQKLGLLDMTEQGSVSSHDIIESGISHRHVEAVRSCLRWCELERNTRCLGFFCGAIPPIVALCLIPFNIDVFLPIFICLLILYVFCVFVYFILRLFERLNLF